MKLVNPKKFYEHVKILNSILDTELGIRISELLEKVIRRLPDEEQFKMKGIISISTRDQAMELWKLTGPKFGISPNFDFPFDGNCSYEVGETIDYSKFIITIVVDNLVEKSDDYIIGLFAHELAEMSYPYRKIMENSDSLKKLKPRAREVMMNKIIHQSDSITDKEHQKHENEVNNEAARLGFEKEIIAMDEM